MALARKTRGTKVLPLPIQVPSELLAKFPAYAQRDILASRSLSKMVLRLHRNGRTPITILDYDDKLRIFFKTLESEPDALLRSNPDWFEIVNDYLDGLAGRNSSRSYIRSSLSGIRNWLRSNGVVFEKDGNRIQTPKQTNKNHDRVPTREELRKILHPASLSLKIQGLLSVSSGMRMRPIRNIKFKNVDLNQEIPLVVVPAEFSKGGRAYVTFLTPETKELILRYIKQRENHGEEITPESYVLVTERPWGRFLSAGAAELRWSTALQIAGLGMFSETQRVLHFHTTRKYFETWCKINGVDGDIVKHWMGHRSSVSQIYLAAGIESLENQDLIKEFRDLYRKCVPALTIFSDEAQIAEARKTLEQATNAQLAKSQEKISALEKQLAELEAGKVQDKKDIEELKAFNRQLVGFKKPRAVDFKFLVGQEPDLYVTSEGKVARFVEGKMVPIDDEAPEGATSEN